MSNILLPKTALYFPTIEFQDEEWLKSALCIWDHIDRIVPPDYVPQDTSEVRQMVDHGLIRSIKLTLNDLNDAADSFSRPLKKCC